MNKAFEKILERLEEDARFYNSASDVDQNIRSGLIIAKEAVQEVAEEYNGGWIPCSERLPKESGEYLTFVNYDDDEFIAIDEFDCEGIMTKWNCTPNYHVIAWQPLPEPYQQKGE